MFSPSNRVYLFGHVVFDEHNFPYHATTKSVSQQSLELLTFLGQESWLSTSPNILVSIHNPDGIQNNLFIDLQVLSEHSNSIHVTQNEHAMLTSRKL